EITSSSPAHRLAENQMEASFPCWRKPSRKTSPPLPNRKPSPSAAEALNCAWSQKIWSLREERRAPRKNPTRSQIGNPTSTRGLDGETPTNQQSRHLFSSRLRC